MKRRTSEENIFTQITNEEKDIYLKYLKDESLFDGLSVRIKRKNEKIEEEKTRLQKEKEQLEQLKQKNLEEKLKKDNDYMYMPRTMWLETYVEHFEKLYGPFYYSTNDLLYQEKYKELLDYFEGTCGISNVEDILKSHRSLSH